VRASIAPPSLRTTPFHQPTAVNVNAHAQSMRAGGLSTTNRIPLASLLAVQSFGPLRWMRFLASPVRGGGRQ
jgi:hypothetical protein